MTPTQYGRYQVQSRLGRGGMATVYLAYDPRMDRLVALKILPPGFLQDPTFQARFDREVKIIARLEHPAIIPVYDYGQDHNCPYLVMRLMKGGSLRDRLQRGALTLSETQSIMARICDALATAHAQHIIHRDLKPANILFDEHSNPYLADFGIARLVEKTQTMTIAGTPQYMAPEQALGHGLDGRTDVYQMGIVLYEMLTGRAPFDAATLPALLYQHANAPVPRPSDSNPRLPPAADAIVMRALAKEPYQRYQTISELGSAMTRLPPVPRDGDATRVAPAAARAALPPSGTATVPRPAAGAGRHRASKKRWPLWARLLAGGVALALLAAGTVFGLGAIGLLPGRDGTPTVDSAQTAAYEAAQVALAAPAETPTPTRTPTLTPSPLPTDAPAPTDTATPTETAAPTATPTPTRTKAPTPTPIASSTATPTETATRPPSPTATFTPAGAAQPTPTGTPTSASQDATAEPVVGTIQSGVYYLFYQDVEWNRDIGLYESGWRVLDLVGLNAVVFIKTDAPDLLWAFDYDPSFRGAAQCFSPGHEYELVVHKAGEHDKSLIHYRIDELGQQGFIYEWDPNVNYMQLWCLESFFVVMFPDGGLYRGMYGEPVLPWPIGMPQRTPWWIGRAW